MGVFGLRIGVSGFRFVTKSLSGQFDHLFVSGFILLCLVSSCYVWSPPVTSGFLPSHLQYQEKLHMKENHIARLSSTVDRMLKESNEWMKMAAEEKKSLLDEKVRIYIATI